MYNQLALKQFPSVDSHTAGCHYQDAYCPLFSHRTECPVSLAQILICTCRDEVPATAWTKRAHSFNWHSPENCRSATLRLEVQNIEQSALRWHFCQSSVLGDTRILPDIPTTTPMTFLITYSGSGPPTAPEGNLINQEAKSQTRTETVQRVFFCKPSSNSECQLGQCPVLWIWQYSILYPRF